MMTAPASVGPPVATYAAYATPAAITPTDSPVTPAAATGRSSRGMVVDGARKLTRSPYVQDVRPVKAKWRPAGRFVTKLRPGGYPGMTLTSRRGDSAATRPRP